MKINILRFFIVVVVFVFSYFSGYAQKKDRLATIAKEECILDYKVLLKVDSLGVLNVSENIKVYVKGEKIKHGIFRKIPLIENLIDVRKDYYSIQIISVKHNGKLSNFKKAVKKNQLELQIGDNDVLIPKGVHDYEISYKTKGVVKFLDNYDEIYWNVTGNNWDFKIGEVEAKLILPNNVDVIKNLCFTGAKGSSTSNCNIEVKNDTIVFKQTTGLNKQHGLTIASQFKKNAINTAELLHLNKTIQWQSTLVPSLVFGGVLMLIWLLTSGYFYKKPYYPNFEIPKDISPAMARYLVNAKLDNISFMSQLISLQLKKAISFKSSNKLTQITNTNNSSSFEHLAVDEKNVYRELFQRVKSPINLSYKRDFRLVNAKIIGLKTVKEECFKLGYFKKNWPYAILIVLMFIGYLLYVGLHLFQKQYYEDILPVFFAVPFIGILAVPIIFYTNGGLKVFSIIFFTIVVLFIFFSPIIFKITLLIPVIAFVITWLYIKNLKVYTRKGTHKRSQIKGLKLFLKVAEEKRFKFYNSMEEKLQVFEQFLPYAIALDLKSQWLDQFENVISLMSEDLSQIISETESFTYRVEKATYKSSNIYTSTSRESYTKTSSSSSSSSGSSGGGLGGGGGGGW